MTNHERRRWSLWVGACEHRAVLPWVRLAIRLAQAAEDDAEYRRLLRHYEGLQRQLDHIDADLWALDPDWCEEVLAKFYGRHADGSVDRARRVR
jgi:hypothetical protein